MIHCRLTAEDGLPYGQTTKTGRSIFGWRRFFGTYERRSSRHSRSTCKRKIAKCRAYLHLARSVAVCWSMNCHVTSAKAAGLFYPARLLFFYFRISCTILYYPERTKLHIANHRLSRYRWRILMPSADSSLLDPGLCANTERSFEAGSSCSGSARNVCTGCYLVQVRHIHAASERISGCICWRLWH
jgi:hypothetical protein